MAVIRKSAGATKPATKTEETKKTAAPKVEAKKPEAKKTASTPKKEAPKKTAAPKAKKEFDLDLSTTKKIKTVEDINLGKCGSLKRDDFYLLVLEQLKAEGINLGSKEKVAKIFSTMEEIIMSALADANTFHFGGRNFNRKAVNARVYNPPIGKSYLVMPHYNMRYSLNEAENISGEMNDEGNFVADDGTVYTQEDLARISEEYFASFGETE